MLYGHEAFPPLILHLLFLNGNMNVKELQQNYTQADAWVDSLQFLKVSAEEAVFNGIYSNIQSGT